MENAADLVGGVPAQAEDDLVSILYDVKRASALQQSQLLAETLLDHVTQDRRLEQRGVKQAGFVVLKSVEFPSVLVETAFINNPARRGCSRAPSSSARSRSQLAAGVRAYLEQGRHRLRRRARATTARASARLSARGLRAAARTPEPAAGVLPPGLGRLARAASATRAARAARCARPRHVERAVLRALPPGSARARRAPACRCPSGPPPGPACRSCRRRAAMKLLTATV